MPGKWFDRNREVTKKPGTAQAMHAPIPKVANHRDTNIVVKHIIADTIMRGRLVNEGTDLDDLLKETVGKLTLAFHVQDRLLTEQEVSDRWPFLDITKLRNMRYRRQGPKYLKFGKAQNGRIYYRVGDIETWIVSNYQLEPLISG